MDWVAIANLFVSSISSLAAVVQAHNSNKVEPKDIKKAQQRIDTPLKRGGKQLIDIIDNNLLLVLTSKAEDEARELLSAISSDTDIESINQLITDANKRICFYLQKIREHNQSELPTERLKSLWASHNCIECKDVKHVE